MQSENSDFLNLDNFKKKAIVSFFLKLAVLSSIWYFAYNIFLRPARLIDRPLTNFLTVCSVKSINFLTAANPPLGWKEQPTMAFIINEKGQKIFGIMDVCNGLDLIFIYISILILLPFSARRKWVFSSLGAIFLIIANVGRICCLFFISKYYHPAFDISHHYLFTAMMYMLIFYGWLLFIKTKPLQP